MNGLEKELTQRIKISKDFDFEGLKILACHRGQTIVNCSVGKTYRYYDLASLTKIIFSTTALMNYFEQGKFKIDDPVILYLPWYPKPQTTIGQLMNHSAGHTWWEPFYKKIDQSLSIPERWLQLLKMCQEAPLKKSAKATYSDLDFFILGALLEKLSGRPMILLWEEVKEKCWPESHFHFVSLPSTARDVKDYAPTEKCPWRKKVMQGEVHDENAWSLGGVAPHAGLFGQMEDMKAYGFFLRDQMLQSNPVTFSRKTMQTFTQRSLDKKQGDWGYGFMLPSEKKSSAGELFSRKSFGHTGFTGTSFWYDPERDLFVTLLSNRIHPKRDQMGFTILRPQIHDWIVEWIEVQT